MLLLQKKFPPKQKRMQYPEFPLQHGHKYDLSTVFSTPTPTPFLICDVLKG